MNMPRKNLYLITSVLGLAAIFGVPYFVPAKTPTLSVSFDFGFNNKAGIALVGIVSLVFIVFGFLTKEKFEISMLKLSFSKDNGISRERFYTVLVISILVIVYIWLTINPVYEKDVCGVGESAYFIPHLYEMSFGRIPYKDFEFCYGSLYLYIPWGIHLLLPFLSLASVYFIFLLILTCLSVYLLYDLLGAFVLPQDDKQFLFTLIAICTLPWTSGIQYTLQRFILPFWFFYKLHGIERKKSWLYVALTFICSMVCLNTSPELGLSFCLAVTVYNAFCFFYERKKIYAASFVLPILAAAVSYLLLPDMFLTIFSFSSGDLNWPFVISFILVVFFGCLFWLSFFIGIQLRSIKDNLFELSFELMAFGFIPAALGRCDPGHVYFNGFFIILFAYILFIEFSPIKKVFSRILVTLIFCSCIPFYLYTVGPIYMVLTAKSAFYYLSVNSKKELAIPDFMISFVEKLGFQNPEEKIARFTNTVLKKNPIDTIYSEHFVDYKNIAAPLGCKSSLYLWLNRQGKYCALYARDSGTVGTLIRNYDLLVDKNPDCLILPRNWTKFIEYQSQKEALEILFMAPYLMKPKNNGNEVYKPLINWINDNFEEAFQLNEGEVVLKRKI